MHCTISYNTRPYQLLFGGNAVVPFDGSRYMNPRDNTKNVI